jgi:hypothetical protein
LVVTSLQHDGVSIADVPRQKNRLVSMAIAGELGGCETDAA